MKKVLFVLICAILVSFQSCKEEKGAIVEVISPQEVYDAVYSKDTEAQLVDVRTSSEFTVSHLKNAQNICVTNNDFKEKVKE